MRSEPRSGRTSSAASYPSSRRWPSTREHPFPFISTQTLNLAVMVPGDRPRRERFVRVKVPQNRPRWIPVPEGAGFVPLEQVIAANIDLMFPASPPREIFLFRVTRGAEGHPERSAELSVEDALAEPGHHRARRVG